ncbi:FecR family protein [Pedobacter westerhofensis]|uniref:FecR family protein n=1 Tax=Pedobacter westerhofensis TaxID=425512 RepID=A0A521B8M5_9SPHI|nr:FecR family protein [Pedobacter westerhofensis]SMO43361.1 FecR family protein [Pedobacter westerhofensis]
MKTDKAEDLIKKYIHGTASSDEEALLENWYDQTALNLKDLPEMPDYPKIEQKILMALRKEQRAVPSMPIWQRFAAAAAVLVLIANGLFYINKDNDQQLLVVQKDIIPGGNNAVLTLANGRKINLSSGGSGNILNTGNITISKNGSGQVTYQVNHTRPADTNPAHTELAYNTISTPKGGQWNVLLADGTHVWLNATSELSFPQAFQGAERVVTLKGEAYFEVAKDKSHPFVVKSKQQEVKVLGTHFNINSYDDEPSVKTTLLEGSVEVSSSRLQLVIEPGEQVMNTEDVLKKVKMADPEEVTAWKKGLFYFDNTDVKTLMRQLARWYDIEVVYEGKPSKYKFAGELRRNMALANVLQILEQGGIHLKMEGRKLIVIP